jgi:CBS domain containing-hemolysin-like protein
MILSQIYFSLIFLAFSLIIYAFRAALTGYSKTEITEIFAYKMLSPLRWLKKTLPEGDMESLLSLLGHTKQIMLLSFYTSALVYLISNDIPYPISSNSVPFFYFFLSGIILALIILATLGLSNILTKIARKGVIKLFAYPVLIPLVLFIPLTYPIILFQRKLSPKAPVDPKKNQLKSLLLDLISNGSIDPIEPIKKQYLYSLAHFDDKTCREIMIPRIKIQCLQDTSSIFEAVTLFIEEGYSRLPIFENTIDHITGVLLYKDVLEYTFKRGFHDLEEKKKTPILSLVTPILYAPENKKISELFQVMRARKIHAAIIVNEYGCTEGLVTIEDIVEELIGSEIFDEHDEEDDLIYKKTHDMGWIIEANVSIIDAEREFGIKLPHNSEYETIGGFISTKMGIVPKPGSIIHYDGYEIKVLSSNERKILKVKITAS